MTQRLIQLYRRIDALQRKRLFKIAFTVAIAVIIGSLAGWLATARPAGAPNFLTLQTSNEPLIWTALLVFGWWLLVIWLNLSLTYLLIGVGTGLLASLIFALGFPGGALAIAGMGTLGFTFVLLMSVVLLLFRYPSQVLAVAHTVVKESVRLRISVVFIIALLIILPLIPLMVESDQELRYRIQSFISFSTGWTFYLAAFMTIFLACGTVAFEIRDRQIWQLMTKPLTRLNYLIGKWVGIASVNLVILIVAGLSIFMFVQYLRHQPAANELDRNKVENEVLVARVGAIPRYEEINRDLLMEEVDRRIENDFTLRQDIESGQRSELAEKQRIAREIVETFSRAQRTIGPGEMKKYTFHGLGAARDRGANIHFRYRIHYGNDDTHESRPLVFIVEKNGKFFGMPMDGEYVPTMSQTLTFPAEVVSDDGTFTLAAINGAITMQGDVVPEQGTDLSLNFDADDFEVLYPVGGFEANYFRAMIVMWVKLAFLGMLGLAAATILSFPVACLVTFTVFLAATMGPYLSMSLDQFYIQNNWRIDKWVIKGLATMMVFLFEPFGEFNPTQRLVEGRLIAWSGVFKAAALLGLIWSGLTLGLGFLAFRDRELATYSGHG